MKHVKTLLQIIIFVWTTTASFNSLGQNIKAILRQGHYSDLPRNAVNIKSEILKDKSYKPSFLAFEVPSENVQSWILSCKELNPVTIEEVFQRGLVINPVRVPDWFKKLLDQVQAQNREMYAYERPDDKFFTLAIIDKRNNRVLIQCLQR